MHPLFEKASSLTETIIAAAMEVHTRQRTRPRSRPARRIWSVTGTVTEYRGGNFLLLQRVVLKPRSNEKHGTPQS